MSELKAVHAFDVYEEYTKTGDDEQAQVYLKSEADKEIAELEESHKMEVERLLMEIVGLKGQYKDMDVTHTVHIAKMNAKIDKLEEDVAWNKYKRCLAMARWCKDMSVWWNDEQVLRLNEQTGNAKSRRFQEAHKKFVFFFKWHKRWLKIAEQFKEAK